MKGRADDAGPRDLYIVGQSDLVESILAVLEEAGTPTELNDAVVKLVETWEFSQQGKQEPDECPSCLGYGFINDETGNPTNDRNCRKCLDCTGSGVAQAKEGIP